MAFVRYKIVDGRKYYQLVRNYREAGRHRQEVLCHLGTNDSIGAAIEEASREEARHRSAEFKHLRDLEVMTDDIIAMFNNKFGNDLPNLSAAFERARSVRREYENIGRKYLKDSPYFIALEDFAKFEEELEFLDEVLFYHSKVKHAKWCKEQADAQQVKLEKLRRYQK